MAGKNVSFVEGISNKGEVGVPKKKIQRKKRSDPKFINYLLWCLDTGKHKHMLRYVNGEKTQFVVIYTDKKNKHIWKKDDVSLFKDLNDHLGKKLNRKRDYDKEEAWKSRFRANMNKTFSTYIEEINSIKIAKCKREVHYKILERPKPLVGKVDKNQDTETKSPRKKITKTKNMKISVQKDSQVEFLKSLTSIPLGNHGNSEKEGGSTIVSYESFEKDEINKVVSYASFEKDEINKVISNESSEEDIIKQMKFLSYEILEKEVKKDDHYLCLSGNLHMGENRSDKMIFIGENRSDKMELGDNNSGSPPFDWNLCEYLLHDGHESSKYDPFVGHETDKDDEIINNIGDKSDWLSNFANFSLMEDDDNVILG